MAPKAPFRPRLMVFAMALVAMCALALDGLSPAAEALAQCVVTPSPELSFGSVEVGDFADRELVLENTGVTDVAGTVDVSCTGFSLVDTDPTFALAGGERDTFTVRFAPPTEGSFSCLPIGLGDDCGSIIATGAGVILTGACCDPDGTCQVATPADCSTAGGTYQGDGTVCSPNPCPQPTGACCFVTGVCIVQFEAACAVGGGDYQGDFTTCTPNPCPQPTGACCAPEGTCTLDTQTACETAGRSYEGDGTTCTPNPCPQPTGACCTSDGNCAIVTAANCASSLGTYQGDDTPCTPNPCPPPTGACCLDDGTCTLETVVDCATVSGVYQGDGEACAPNPCPQPAGACCFADGTCSLDSPTNCAAVSGTYQGNDTLCAPNPCPQPTGACCAIDGTCTVSTAGECATISGVFQGGGTVCTPNPCPQPPGACCFADGTCQDLTEEDCTTAGGTEFQGDFTDCDPNPCPQPTGACCFTDGTCQELTQEDCTTAGGAVYDGDLTVCSPNPCPQPTGACCFSDGTCQELVEEDCIAALGAFAGDLTTCAPNPCPQPTGACCFLDGTCQELTEEDCTTAGGASFEGDLTVCAPNPCPQPPGACCFLDGTCQELTEEDCTTAGGASFEGDLTVCAPNPCPQPPGACCFLDGTCQELTEEDCTTAEGASFEGDLTVCTPNPCPQPTGACCFTDGSCQELTEEDCTTAGGDTFQGDLTVCDPNPCPQPPGACCFDDGSCQEITEEDCTGGNGLFQGDFSVCDPNPCPQPMGACCFANGTCSVRTQPNCESASGVYQGDDTGCDPNPCPQPTGACCFGDGTCTVLEEAECDAASGAYQGDFVACTPNPCPQPTGACCEASSECQVVTEADCQAGGDLYQGDGTACDPNPCTSLDGACCGPFGGCTVVSFDECTASSGEFQGIASVCDPDPCPEIVGACCFTDGTCVLDTASLCGTQGGAYQGDAIACSPNPCPQPPACGISTTTLDFGEVFLGESADRSFTVTNTGGGLLEGAVSVACAGFQLVGPGAYSLGESEFQEITIRFTPNAVGDAECAIETGSLLCDLVMASGAGTDAPPEPICEVSETSLNFGSVALDGSRMLSFVITNAGEGVLSGAVEPECGDFRVLGDPNYDLGADQSQTFDVVFQPARLGVHSCELETGSECTPIQLSGQSVNEVECDVFPATLDFGDVRVGEFRERQFTVYNASLVRIAGSVSLATGCTDFFLVGEVGYSLDPGEEKTFRVRFEPSGGGPRSCSADAGLSACAPVSLVGAGVPAVCELPETQLDFGAVPLGASVTRSFVVRNTGGGDLLGVATTDCAAVQVTSSPMFSLEANQEATIEVSFTPFELGSYSCTIDLEHPTCGVVTAVGEAVERARCVLSTEALDFGDVVVGEAAQLDFTLRNDGAAPLQGSFFPRSSCSTVVTFVGTSSFDLASGESSTFTVSFTPQELGSFDCIIDMETELADQCTGLAILGAGVAPPSPECELSAELLTFPNTIAGNTTEQVITLTNAGNLELGAQVTASCDAFRIVGDGNVNVAPGESAEIAVRFQPTEAGSFECSLLIDGVACDLVGLRGTALPPPMAACALDPPVVQLGEMEVGLSVQRQVFVTNVGTAPLVGALSSNCPDLAIVGEATYDIPPNQTQSFTVEYTAPEPGNVSCALSVEGGSCTEWPVVGVAQPAGTPVCTVEPPLVDFGFVALGASAERSLTLRNTGGGSLTGVLDIVCPNVTITEGQADFQLRAGQSQSWTLRFEPSAMGDQACIADFGAGACAVPLVGTGSARSLTRTVDQPVEMVSWGVQLGSATVGEIFGGLGTVGNDFQLFHWSPPDSGYQSVEGELDPEPTAALWLEKQSASGEWSYTGDPEDGIYSVRLAGAGGQGPTWHQLGNPYQRTISIDDLEVDDGTGWEPLRSASNQTTEPVLWVWNGGRYEPADTIEPLGGFFLRKIFDREVTLRFDPLREMRLARQARQDEESRFGGLESGIDWLVQCTASQGDARSQTLELGAGAVPAGRWHPLDRAHVPAPPQGMLQLYVPHLDWGRMNGRYLRDLQPDAETIVWDFEMRGYDRGVPIQLALDAAGLPAGLRIFVLNNSEGTATELPLPNQLEWTPTRSVTDLRLVATRRNEPTPPGTVPVDITLIRTPRASPNPFQAQTTFTIQLDAPGEVSVLVFDAHGRRVRELITSESQTGEIEIPWDGKDEYGNDLPSGVYLMRSRGPDRTASLRVVKID